jgi:magnesium chelatase family protein
MLARRLPTLLPPLTEDERLQTTQVHSAAGLLGDHALVGAPPFRAPHHSVTVAGLIGDRRLRPGEVSLAHHGVLFLDEASEFTRSALEVLRAPLEDGVVTLARAEGTVEYPCRILLVLASNPCPCGRRGSSHPCRCTDHEVSKYQRRLSGPLLDRVDLSVQLTPVPAGLWWREQPGESSGVVRERVIEARQRQARRGQRSANGRLSPDEVDRWANPTSEARSLLLHGIERHGLSGRGASKIVKVARTIADLAGRDRIEESHIAEALGFRAPVE